jgi:hypothetical protein
VGKKNRDADWARAKKHCRLSDEDVRLAKELGLNPRKLAKHNPSPNQQWKLPVKLWIRELYANRQRKRRPADKSVGAGVVRCEPTHQSVPPLPATTLSPQLDDIPF